MTEQSPNALFHSSSFLQGQNADYVEQLHARYVDDPASVDASWQAFFAGLEDAAADVTMSARGPSWARADWPPQPSDELTAALDGQCLHALGAEVQTPGERDDRLDVLHLDLG